MDFTFCKLKKLKKHAFYFILFFFASLKKLRKHGFNFRKLKKAQKTWISFCARLKKLKKHRFHFVNA